MTKCAFCLDEINPGAAACRSCGRTQPASAEQRAGRKRVTLMLGVVLVLAAAGAFAGWSAHAKARAIDTAVMRADYCNRHLSRSAVQAQIERLHTPGTSWDGALEAFSATACP